MRGPLVFQITTLFGKRHCRGKWPKVWYDHIWAITLVSVPRKDPQLPLGPTQLPMWPPSSLWAPPSSLLGTSAAFGVLPNSSEALWGPTCFMQLFPTRLLPHYYLAKLEIDLEWIGGAEETTASDSLSPSFLSVNHSQTDMRSHFIKF